MIVFIMRNPWACVLPVLALGMFLVPRAAAGHFESQGVPVTKAMLMSTVVGPDATGEKEWLYFNFAQTGATLFLVAVDPDTGEARQYKSPVGPGAWALIRGPDENMYLGTWESGYILRFNPREAEKGIQVIGKPSATETYIWQYALGQDGKLYGCTYGNAKLIRFDPKTDQMEDLGRMDETQMYTRSVACGPTGKIYTGVGYGRANVVVYDPATGQHRSILPEAFADQTAASVHLGADGQVYAHCGSQAFHIEDETLEVIRAEEVVAAKGLELRDGRSVTVVGTTATTATYTLTDPQSGQETTRSFDYKGDGAMVFMVGLGPENKIYGSTAMPLEMFVHEPGTGENRHLGNPTAVNGELYSMVTWQNRLYVCAYPGSYLSVYDPAKAFKFGTGPEDNPRGFGRLGDGHLRPRTMIVGPDQSLYIGSLPPYGQFGGALAVFDLKKNEVSANFRHVVTNQSVVSLAYDPGSKLVFGGSSVAGGGGTSPVAAEARVFAFDPRQHRIVFDIALEPGATTYPAMCAAQGKLFLTASTGKLFVFNPETKEVIKTLQLPGLPVEIALGLHSSGRLWGLTHRGAYAVDAERLEIVVDEESPVPVRCGFALTEQAIYFGSGSELWRYRLAE